MDMSLAKSEMYNSPSNSQHRCLLNQDCQPLADSETERLRWQTTSSPQIQKPVERSEQKSSRNMELPCKQHLQLCLLPLDTKQPHSLIFNYKQPAGYTEI